MKTLAVSMAIVFLWQWMFPPQAPVEPVKPPVAQPTSAGSPPPSGGSIISELTSQSVTDQARLLGPAQTLKSLSSPVHQVSVNSHGQVDRWEVTEEQYLHYFASGKSEPYLIADSVEETRATLARRAQMKEGEERPQVAPFLSPQVSLLVNDQPLELSYTVVNSAPDGSAVTLRGSGRGFEVERTFTLAPDRYGVNVTLKVRNANAEPAHLKVIGVTRALQDLTESQGGMFSPPLNMLESLCAHGDDLERDPLTSLKDKASESEPLSFNGARWVGVNNRYFMSALSAPHAVGCVQSSTAGDAGLNEAPIGTAPVSTKAMIYEGFVNPQTTLTETLSLYGGPKKLEALKANEPSLSEAIDFGIFTPICLPMLFMMRTFFGLIPNWGVAIILLTILVKLLTLPLTIKQYRSMAAMKKIQPEMQALKEQYQKTDPMRFQQESMALYKKHGVNPVAGCLPMLLMMPVYFALYRTIYSAVELYQASFFGWLNDLSMPDPYLITPVALGLLMLLQARLNPSPGMDPTQRKMMTTFMPLMFGGMMLFLPSGLVLYIFVNTVLGIFQQVWSQKQSEQVA